MDTIKEIVFWGVVFLLSCYGFYSLFKGFEGWIIGIADNRAEYQIDKYIELEKIAKERCEYAGHYTYLGNGKCMFISKLK